MQKKIILQFYKIIINKGFLYKIFQYMFSYLFFIFDSPHVFKAIVNNFYIQKENKLIFENFNFLEKSNFGIIENSIKNFDRKVWFNYRMNYVNIVVDVLCNLNSDYKNLYHKFSSYDPFFLYKPNNFNYLNECYFKTHENLNYNISTIKYKFFFKYSYLNDFIYFYAFDYDFYKSFLN